MTTEDLHPTIKESVIKFLQDQPDDITLEEIQDFLLLKQQILRGQADLREGRSYSQQQVREIVKKWTQ